MPVFRYSQIKRKHDLHNGSVFQIKRKLLRLKENLSCITEVTEFAEFIYPLCKYKKSIFNPNVGVRVFGRSSIYRISEK